ncbi:sensor histidine kinase [Candidatus Protofrankia californiensis]|uniref:sensor histidine kinase n=1 Tax=Candidatus Protofrankia californiensis TaxID=1839754 RepID=UPI001F4951F9|nr:sensor histidine kinase KdpD [Candidatus Protofrankia californiensis]
MSRGTLRVYLGAAPGVGKTFAALDEAHRRRERGTDVVVGFVETHGRPKTVALLKGLEVVPRREISYRGSTFTEMDVDAVLERRPAVALVDELAHTNVPGSRNAKRWQDVQELLQAGIDVISNVNIQHMESLNDVVETITGVSQRETVPDEVVRQADQVELVDMAPEALRRRMAHGNIYAPEKIDAALSNYFRVGNLTALREIALLWVADKVDEQLDRYRAEHGIAGTWETRERVVVALTGGSEGDTLIRRAVRIADRSKGSDLLAVHVARSDGLTGANPQALSHQRTLVESLGGTYHHVIGDNVPTALLDFARAENATQLVLGASRRGRFAQMLSPGIGVTTTKLSGSIDVHMVTHEEAGRGRRLPRLAHGLEPRRRLIATAMAVGLLPLLTVVLAHSRGSLNVTTDVLVYLLAVVIAALVGGFWPALLAAVASSLLLNYYFFTAPRHRWTIAERNNAFALVAFVLVGVMVSRVVDLAARRYSQAVRASAEATTLSVLAGSVLRGEDALPALLERVRETFGMTAATLLERTDEGGQGTGEAGRAKAGPGGAGAAEVDAASEGNRPARLGGRGWRAVHSVGIDPCARPEDGDVDVPVGDNLAMVLRGRPLPAADRRILAAFAAQAALAFEQRRLAEAAAEAGPLAEADRVRTALLAAVSHDLRSPLASAKAAIASLRSRDVIWTPAEQAELLATADESMDRLTRLVDNLLDMSRLQAGVLSVFPRQTGLDDVVPHALDEIGPPGRTVEIQVPDGLPDIYADPTLLERIVVNLASNALRHSPEGTHPVITASALDDRVELRVIDRGPGIPAENRDRVFQPFQRLGDRDNTTGVGLGLALSRGLAEAMGGSLVTDDTPGGGLTMVLSLPAAWSVQQPVPAVAADG